MQHKSIEPKLYQKQNSVLYLLLNLLIFAYQLIEHSLFVPSLLKNLQQNFAEIFCKQIIVERDVTIFHQYLKKEHGF